MNQDKERFALSNITESHVENYIRGVLPKNEGVILEMEEYAQQNHIPIIHSEVAQFLKVLIKIKKPKRILEVGTAIGYSGILMAKAMEEGHLISIERNIDMISLAQANITKSGFTNRIRILQGDAEEILPDLKDSFDFIFLDAAKGQYLQFFKYCISNLSKGGIIVSDNVLYKGMVASDDLVVKRKKTIVKRMREYLDYICNNENLESSIIPIGDGIALTYKKEAKQN